jgi:hypothetical protein
MYIRDEKYSARKGNDVVEDNGLKNLRFNALEVFEKPIDGSVRDDAKNEVDHLFTVTVK